MRISIKRIKTGDIVAGYGKVVESFEPDHNGYVMVSFSDGVSITTEEFHETDFVLIKV